MAVDIVNGFVKGLGVDVEHQLERALPVDVQQRPASSNRCASARYESISMSAPHGPGDAVARRPLPPDSNQLSRPGSAGTAPRSASRS